MRCRNYPTHNAPNLDQSLRRRRSIVFGCDSKQPSLRDGNLSGDLARSKLQQAQTIPDDLGFVEQTCQPGAKRGGECLRSVRPGFGITFTPDWNDAENRDDPLRRNAIGDSEKGLSAASTLTAC